MENVTPIWKKEKKNFSDSFQGCESTTIGANTCGDYLFFFFVLQSIFVQHLLLPFFISVCFDGTIRISAS